jgi:hypothetical protein
MRWTDSLALGCINELIERLPCPGLRLRVFWKKERTPTSGSKGLTAGYLLISPVFGKWNNALHHQLGFTNKSIIQQIQLFYLHHPPPKIVNMRRNEMEKRVMAWEKSEYEMMDSKNMHADFIKITSQKVQL